MSLTIQYKAVTRVDVTPAILVHPSAFHERRGSVRGERDGQGGEEREKHTSPPPTIPLAGTVICCMHASRDG